jgi:hypothetical protein
MKIVERVKSFFSPKGTGALIDVRPESKKEKDYHFEEIVASSNPVVWIEKPEAQWRKFPIFDQNGSGSCVAKTLAKLLGILLWQKEGRYVHFSATHIYQRRANRPLGGMAGVDSLDIARKGVTLEELVPSQNMTDEQMDAIEIENYKERVGEVFKIDNYVVLPTSDIDTVASTIQTTGKGVMVWFFFEGREWLDTPVVLNRSLSVTGANTLRHSVAAVDYALVKGKKALIIEDSWGPGHGLGGRRVITEEFYRARNFFAAYPISFQFHEQGPSELLKKNFNKDLVFIPWDATFNRPRDWKTHQEQLVDVKALQDILKAEGLFPRNVDSTGYYGSISAKAVFEFQKRYAVASDAEIESLGGRIVGPKTRAVLNSIYGPRS